MSATKISTALNLSKGNLQEAVELLLMGEDSKYDSLAILAQISQQTKRRKEGL